jgi:hypothetical protein
MSTGYAFIDCPNLVPIAGTPVWKTKRILELPVKLEPNQLYQACLNSQIYSDIRSENAIPMNPDYFVFRTKNYNYSGTIDTASNRLNFENFCNYFLQHYSYKYISGINWENEFNAIKDEIVLSKSKDEFGLYLLKVLKKANDIHLSLIIKNMQFMCGSFRIVPVNYNYSDVTSKLSDMQTSDNGAVLSGLVSNCGYILIASLENQYASDISFAIDKVKQMKDLPVLLIDLRLNRGGNEQLAASFVSMILSDTITYEKVTLYNESTRKFDFTLTKKVFPDINSIHYSGKIFVLTGGNVVSSAESFVLMLKQIPDLQVTGSKTYGSSGNPQPYEAADSIIVNIPSWLAYDCNDSLIEGHGIVPDLTLDFPREDFETKDPVFQYVLDSVIHIPFISVSDLSIRFLNSAGSHLIDIKSNVKWAITCDQPWIKIDCSIDSSTFFVSATENLGSLSRNGTITISGNGVPDKIIYVTQNGAPPVLSVSETNMIFQAAANSTDTFKIVSNTLWNLKSNQPWLTLDISSGSDTAMIIATANENTTGKERAASIAVSANRLSTIYISVHQVAQIINSEDEISKDKLVVYPNPVEGILNISGINFLQSKTTIEISDNAGNILNVLHPEKESALTIEMTDYPSGLYLVRIQSGNINKEFKVIKL